MAFHYSTPLDIIIGEPPRSYDKTFLVGTGRVGKQMAVYVTNDYNDQRFHKFVSLKWYWWQITSPSERIRRVMDKAQRIADKANHEELYLSHESELVSR